MSTLEELLAPISEAAPCGEDIAFSPELDAIDKARKEDDPSLEQGAWVTTLKSADWKFVATRCDKLIASTSKDLKLAGWLAEARCKLDGVRGLADGLQLAAGLCERFWDHVHPQPDEDGYERRIGNLGWLAAQVPQLLKEVPLTEGAGYTMIDIEAARARPADGEPGPDVDGARKRTSHKFYQSLLADLAFCLDTVDLLERAVDERLGADGPSFSAARAAVDNLVHVVEQSARDVGALMGTAPATASDSPGEVVAQAGPGLVPAAPVGAAQSRAQALAQLRAVADFFRRTEPHSPVAYLAEKAAAWGEQPLHVWLRNVIKDPAMCGQLDELLGVQDPG
ncbi:MAG: type VI secretion system protein TssA [Gammaproteobacteria bacterium]